MEIPPTPHCFAKNLGKILLPDSPREAACIFDFAALNRLRRVPPIPKELFSDLIRSLVSLRHAIGATFWEVLMGLGDLFKKISARRLRPPSTSARSRARARMCSHHHFASASRRRFHRASMPNWNSPRTNRPPRRATHPIQLRPQLARVTPRSMALESIRPPNPNQCPPGSIVQACRGIPIRLSRNPL
jgi:hypothetical protein